MNVRVVILPLALLLLLTLSLSAGAQWNAPSKRQHRNSLFLELGGMGPYYSLNLDHLFSRRKMDRLFRHRSSVILSYRLGVSVQPSLISFPLGLSLISSPMSMHHAEFSVGIAPLLKNPFTILSQGFGVDKMLLLGVGGGYRYQKPGKGLFLTIGIKPLLRLDPSSGDILTMEKKLLYSGYVGIGQTL